MSISVTTGSVSGSVYTRSDPGAAVVVVGGSVVVVVAGSVVVVGAKAAADVAGAMLVVVSVPLSPHPMAGRARTTAAASNSPTGKI